MSEWQPIETAPTKGWFLAYRLIDGVPMIEQARWKTDFLGRKCVGGISWSYGEQSMPTHWMPLPATPSKP
jgi:hypothetical protein